ncbi:MAG TPA: hypothetical protein VKX17_00145 [Planctomycetota bacterium]|nr:hypothetical protein [Planctomycetota bacterium]
MPPTKKPFQIHLSTAVAMMFVAGLLMWLHSGPRHYGPFYIYGWPPFEFLALEGERIGSEVSANMLCSATVLTPLALWITWYTLETCIQSKMSSLRAILMVALSTGIFTLGFMAGGFFIAKMAPDYYIVMFSHSYRDAPFDPAQLGVGLGLTQGAYVGIIVGVLAVLVEAWYRHKKLNLAQPTDGSV